MASTTTVVVALVACLLATHAAGQPNPCGSGMLCPNAVSGTGTPITVDGTPSGVPGQCYTTANNQNCLSFTSLTSEQTVSTLCPAGDCACPNSMGGAGCFTSTTCPSGYGPPSCPTTSGGKGDPVFTGFDGQAFSFDGVPGKVFNLISEQNHQLNALFTFTEMSVHNGTTMSDIGLKVGPHTVVVHVNPGSSLTASVDGKEMNTAILQSSVTLDAPPLNVTYEMFRPRYGHAIEVVTTGMRFLIYSTKPYTDEGGVRVQSYLNFETTLLNVPADNKIHGVMGQSYYRANPVASTRSEDPNYQLGDGDNVILLDTTQRSSLLEVPEDKLKNKTSSSVLPCTGLVEGVDVDYVVSSLTGDDFKYNMFNRAAEKSSRRLLSSVEAPASIYMVASFSG